MNLSKNTKRRIVTALAEKKSAEELIAAVEAGSGGGGTINGAINLGAGGVGVFDSVGGSNLQFKNINAGSAKITVSDDSGNKEIDIDVSENEINVRNLKNVSPGVNGSFAGWSDTGTLSSVAGYTFDDIGTLRVGAQNSITVPAGVTDYFSIGISPTISNPGLTNLSGVQLNSPINAVVTNYNGFTVNGYGTSAPSNYSGFSSDVNYSGTGISATHFRASSPWNISGAMTGFRFYATGNAASFQGIDITATGSYTDTSGLKIDLSSVSSTNRKAGIELTEGSLSAFFTFSTTSSLPTLVDSGNIVRPVFQVKSGSAITGTDVLMSNLAGFMDIKDNYSGSPLGLGIASVGFVSQVAVASGKTASNVSMLTAGVAVDSTSAGGTITDLHLIRGFSANFGGSLNIGTIYGLQIESGISALATAAFGISVEDAGAENYLAKSLKVGGVSKVVSDSSIGLELGSTKTLRLAVVTTSQRTALPAIAGTMVFDSDLGKGYIHDGTSWNQFG